ncbi:MAG: ABC transporter substrate-binding protein [Rhodomicrobium sp.]|jgi:branched-chain amino acid transport system substrate-binding protein
MALINKLAAGALLSGLAAASAAHAAELIIPALEYRTGAYAPDGIPLANGYEDYFTLLNERDGGIGGVRIKIVPCETSYDNKLGVECYEKTKQGALVVSPFSTGITYALIPKAPADKIPILSSAYGRTSVANGRVFPWVFNFPVNYWSAASVIVKYIGDKEGGMDKLKGKKIALVYHNSAYGKEPIPTLTALSKKHGFEFVAYPVDPPGNEQKATWLQVRRDRPDWVLLWGWGVMNQVAIKDAAGIRFPMDHFIGNWWSSSDNDVKPAGTEATGFLGTAFHAAGAGFPVHKDVLKYVYDAGKAVDPGFKDRIGEVLYNRGLVTAMYTAEAIATAQKIHKTKEVTGEMVRNGFEALDITADRLKQLGFERLVEPVRVTCANHEGRARGAVQQWDAKVGKWKLVSNYFDSDREVIDPLIKSDSEQYAKENNITPRDCK